MDKKEVLLKAKEATSKEDIIALMKENGVEISEKDAEEVFLNKDKFCEVDEETLSKVQGGTGGITRYDDSGNRPKYNIGDEAYHYGVFVHKVKIINREETRSLRKNWVGRDSLQYRYEIAYDNGFMNWIQGNEWVWESELSYSEYDETGK